MDAERLINQARWIWLPDYDDAKQEARFVLFRKTFHLDEIPAGPQLVRVSADTRYRMLVNEHNASFGPCKSFLSKWYFEEVDISPFLRTGKNVISIRVLRFSPAHLGNSSMIRGVLPGLLLQGDVDDVQLDTNESWRVIEDKSVSIIPRSEWNYALGPPFMCLSERCDQRLAQQNWSSIDFDDSRWATATFLSARSMMMPILEPRRLSQRPIPLLPEIESKFKHALKCEGSVTVEQWNDLVRGKDFVEIPAGKTVSVDIENEVLTTGFLRLLCDAGSGSKITIICAESYERKHTHIGKIGAERFKSDRRDFQNGELYGPEDEFTTIDGENTYEPFWFRTFRFVRLLINVSNQRSMKLKKFDFRETHYPLDIKTHISAPAEVENLWKISLNTLRNCMHETYEDCPFYEQNQFAMDTRIQILFTYQLSRDDRLARKCIHEFYASRRDDGLVETHFPVPFRAINIPQFSLYWVLMVCDHFQYFGDAQFARRYLGTIDGVLNHFLERREDRGLVGRFDDESWPFVDWVKEWHGKGGLKTMAIPPCYYQGDGVVTYNSLIVAYVLHRAATLNSGLGRDSVAKEYSEQARDFTTAVNQHCWDGEMYVDGPSTKARCQHSQIFAILSGAVTGEEAVKLLRKTIANPELPKCSFAMSFYIFRAASQVGLYEELYDQLIQPWRKMMSNNLTTWAEDDVMFRSDCHGWSASPIYEIAQEICGLSSADASYKKVKISPKVDLVPEMKAKLVIGKGNIQVSWDDSKKLQLQSDQDIEADILIKGKSNSPVQLKAGQTITIDY